MSDKHYIIKWHKLSNANICGHSQQPMSYRDAYAWKVEMNRKYPEFVHTVIEAS